MGNVRSVSGFEWDEKRSKAAIMLAQGYLTNEVAKAVKVSERTVWRWKADIEFAAEVDRLSLMVDISGRAERMRIAMRIVRELNSRTRKTDKDLLDWLKFAQSETDGVKLDLTKLLSALSDDEAPLASSGPVGASGHEEAVSEEDQTNE